MAYSKQDSTSIQIENLVKVFPSYDKQEDVYAVNDISLDFSKGELTTLLGPSGCGKTTTLRMLAGFEYPTSGKIIIDGKDMTNIPPNKRNIGMIFQNYALFPHLTVFENVAYGLRIQKMSNRVVESKVNDVLALLKIEELRDRKPDQISGGQQQRIAIARSIVIEPSILLFDEPLSNLDAKLREYMRMELRQIQQRLDITSIYVTHDQEEAMAISDKVVIMNKGKIQQQGSPIDIYTKPKNRFVADFIGKTNFIEGMVKEINDNLVVINIEGYSLTTDNNDDNLQKGDTVECVIRPEFLTITPNGDLEGTVTRSTFLGQYIEYEVKIGKQTVTLINNYNPNISVVKVNSKIKLRLLTPNFKCFKKNNH